MHETGQSQVSLVAGRRIAVADELQDKLQQAGLTVHRCEELFTVTAQLAQGKVPAAVLIDVDHLDEEQMKFFELMSRWPQVMVYVFSHRPEEARLNRAVRSGAVSITDELLTDAQTIVRRLTDRRQAQSPSAGEPPVTEPMATAEASAAEPAAAAQATARPRGSISQLRQQTARRRAKRTQPQPDEALPPQARRSQPPPTEPPGTGDVLLTPEEIEALTEPLADE